jgi:hypothetical protein
MIPFIRVYPRGADMILWVKKGSFWIKYYVTYVTILINYRHYI